MMSVLAASPSSCRFAVIIGERLTIPSVQTYAGGNLLSQEVIFSHEVLVTQPEFLVYRAYDIRSRFLRKYGR